MVNGKISKNKKLILIISIIILVILLFVIIVSIIYYLFIKSNKTEEERVIQDLPVDLDNKVILINDRFIRYDPGLYTGPQSAEGVVHRGPKLVKVN